MAGLDVAIPTGPLYRLARRPDPWAWPDWAFAGPDGTFGNRYDDPRSEYRVLYAGSDRLTCFLETLARFRPDPHVVAAAIAPDPRDGDHPTAPAGQVPVTWVEGRAIGTIDVTWPFADVGTRASLAHLRAALPDVLVRHGLGDLDGATVRASAPRSVTQAVSRHVYEEAETVGVRYLSRLGDDGVNWAIQEPVSLPPSRSEDVAADDPDLVAAVGLFGLALV